MEGHGKKSSSACNRCVKRSSGCAISRNPRDRNPIVDCESLTDPMFCQSHNYYYRISPDDSTGATSASSSGESLSGSPSGKMETQEPHRPVSRCQQMISRRPVKRSNTVGAADKNILFLQYKRQQHEDRELLKELWRRKQEQHPVNRALSSSLNRASSDLKPHQTTCLTRTRSDLNLTDPNWYLIVPSQRVRQRECDEVPDEFKRAGIGLCFEDERDAIQKKTFTKWVNKHLKKTGRNCRDLFEDLRDGHNLLSLLEVLSGETLPRERGRMRFHSIQNVETALRFLRYKEIKLVNIRGEDIVDGNPKLTLGLIWTIILHFQISDIVVGQDDISAKEALLRWIQKTTTKYPNVNVRDFTSSWRDGLAFNAIIHRNRPDLVEWSRVERRQVRDRIEEAFYIMEKEFGVTRLLDPEDVDTPEPDEKSVITYVSQLYDVFPEPPIVHPLVDAEGQHRLEQYCDRARALLGWIVEQNSNMMGPLLQSTLTELKQMAEDSHRFKFRELPQRQEEKKQLQLLYNSIDQHLKDCAISSLTPEIQPESMEKSFKQLISTFEKRHQKIMAEMERLENLHRLSEKILRDGKITENKLNHLEAWIENEAGKIKDQLREVSKKNCDEIFHQLQKVKDDDINHLINDVKVLTENKFHLANDHHKRVENLLDKWIYIQSLGKTKLMNVLSIQTNPDFKFLNECLVWVIKKQGESQNFEVGNDLRSVSEAKESHQKDHKIVEKFRLTVEKCLEASIRLHGDELEIYNQKVAILSEAYEQLLVLSNKKTRDLNSLHYFLSSASEEISWLLKKEDIEIQRDWSDRNVNITLIENYYEKLMSEFESREARFTAVQDEGKSLISNQHPASATIETFLIKLQSKWTWLLQLTICLETHLRHLTNSQNFYRECHKTEERLKECEEKLNSQFSKSEFKLDEGEKLLKEMQKLQDELSKVEEKVQRLLQMSKEVTPLSLRKEKLRKPIDAISICKFENYQMPIQRDEVCTVQTNSGNIWKVSNFRGLQGEAPGVIFLLNPPDQEAIDTVDRLRNYSDRINSLWQKKHLRMRQNMIFATIKVVKGWDFQQFSTMDGGKRKAIRRALYDDSEKLVQEGETNDPQLKRLQREISEVNSLFDEWERLADLEKQREQAEKTFNDKCTNFEKILANFEKTLDKVCKSPLPRDLEALQSLVSKHKEFENSLQEHESVLKLVKTSLGALPEQNPENRGRVEKIADRWKRVWSMSCSYVERLKVVEVTLTGLEVVAEAVTDFESKLSSYDNIPNDMGSLRKVLDELMILEVEIQEKQPMIDQLGEDVKQVRPAVEKTRPTVNKNPDVERLEDEVNRKIKLWGTYCTQVIERLCSCNTARELLEKYNMSYKSETNWMDELDSKLKNLVDLESARAQEAWEKHVELTLTLSQPDQIKELNDDGKAILCEIKVCQASMEQMKPVIELKDSDNPHLSAIKDKLNLSNQNYHSLCNRILKEVEVHGEHVLMSDKESHEFLKFVKDFLISSRFCKESYLHFSEHDNKGSLKQEKVVEAQDCSQLQCLRMELALDLDKNLERRTNSLQNCADKEIQPKPSSEMDESPITSVEMDRSIGELESVGLMFHNLSSPDDNISPLSEISEAVEDKHFEEVDSAAKKVSTVSLQDDQNASIDMEMDRSMSELEDENSSIFFRPLYSDNSPDEIKESSPDNYSGLKMEKTSSVSMGDVETNIGFLDQMTIFEQVQNDEQNDNPDQNMDNGNNGDAKSELSKEAEKCFISIPVTVDKFDCDESEKSWNQLQNQMLHEQQTHKDNHDFDSTFQRCTSSGEPVPGAPLLDNNFYGVCQNSVKAIEDSNSEMFGNSLGQDGSRGNIISDRLNSLEIKQDSVELKRTTSNENLSLSGPPGDSSPDCQNSGDSIEGNDDIQETKSSTYADILDPDFDNSEKDEFSYGSNSCHNLLEVQIAKDSNSTKQYTKVSREKLEFHELESDTSKSPNRNKQFGDLTEEKPSEIGTPCQTFHEFDRLESEDSLNVNRNGFFKSPEMQTGKVKEETSSPKPSRTSEEENYIFVEADSGKPTITGFDFSTGTDDQVQHTIQEKLEHANDNLDSLNAWLDQVQGLIANQEDVSEDLGDLQNQIEIMRGLKTEVDDHNRQINSTIDMIAELHETGEDVLNNEELKKLQIEGDKLRDRFDFVSNSLDILFKRIVSAQEEILKYKSEMETFKKWMEGVTKKLIEKESLLGELKMLDVNFAVVKELANDIMVHGADFKFINLTCQKFLDLSKDYKNVLKELQTSPSREEADNPESSISTEITQVGSDYASLSLRANQLVDDYTEITELYRDYANGLERTKKWLKKMESRVTAETNQPLGKESKVIEDQLNAAKTLQTEIVANYKLISDVSEAEADLLGSLVSSHLDQNGRMEVQDMTSELLTTYQRFSDTIAMWCQTLENSLGQSQCLKNALEGISRRLGNAEDQFEFQPKQASLIRERLNDQIKQLTQLQLDVRNHKESMEEFNLLFQSDNTRKSKEVVRAFQEMTERFLILESLTSERNLFLRKVLNELDGFVDSAESFDNWYIEIMEFYRESSQAARVEEVVKQAEVKRMSFEDMIDQGKNLVEMDDVTDTDLCNFKIAELEEKWSTLSNILKQHQEENSARLSNLKAYKKQNDIVTSWLMKMEEKLKSLSPIAVEVEKLIGQREEIGILTKECNNFSIQIDELNRTAEVLLKIPGKNVLMPGRLSDSLSSSRDEFARPNEDESDEASQIYSQVSDANRNLEVILQKLDERDRDLEKMVEDLSEYTKNLAQLSEFVNSRAEKMSDLKIHSDKQESIQQREVVRDVQQEMSDHQPILEKSKGRIREISRRFPDSYGLEQLETSLRKVDSDWKNLEEKCQTFATFFTELEDFYVKYESLNSWLNSKERMIDVLGSIGSDPRLVQNQSSQVNVIRDEFCERVNQKVKFNDIGENLLAQNGYHIQTHLEQVNEKWNVLSEKLENYERALESLMGPTSDFHRLIRDLQDDLAGISDQLEDVIGNNSSVQEKLYLLEEISQQLGNQREKWANVEKVGSELSKLLSDPSSRSEITGKLGAVERQFNSCQKKLDGAIAENEVSVRELYEFEDEFVKSQQRLSDYEDVLFDQLQISADPGKLLLQNQDFEPFYRDVMDTEHEIVMLINKGKICCTFLSNEDIKSRTNDLENFGLQWQAVKKAAMDRQKRLSTTLELNKKFLRAYNNFQQWLEGAERHLESMPPISFVKATLLTQEKDLQTFRYEVSGRASELDSICNNAGTFLDSCDIDKENIERDLEGLRDAWNLLNGNLVSRSSSIADIQAQLNDLGEVLKDVEGNLTRIEDRFSSLDKSPKDSTTLDAVKSLKNELMNLKNLFVKVKYESQDLERLAGDLGSEATCWTDAVSNVELRIDQLQQSLEDKTEDLENTKNNLEKFNDSVKDLNISFSSFNDELSKIGHSGRDLRTLQSQGEKVLRLEKQMEDLKEQLAGAERCSDDVSKQGGLSPEELNLVVTNLATQLDKLQDKLEGKAEEIQTAISKVKAFYNQHKNVLLAIHDAEREEEAFEAVAGEVDVIKSQQADLKRFQKTLVEVLSIEVGQTNKVGQDLIQTASTGVDTSELESDLEQLNDLWNGLKDVISDREKKLDQGLLQAGKFQEALASLIGWFEEMNEMIQSQNPPSSDFKVVRAQVQEQKFVLKLLGDRLGAINSIIELGKDISKSDNPTVENEIFQVELDYENLSKKCLERMNLLEEAIQMAKEYHDKLASNEQWLNQMEQNLKQLETVPTDETQIQKQIERHQEIHEDILKQQPSFDDLADIASALMQVVGDEDAQGLADKIEDITNHYGQLVNSSDNLSHLLETSVSGLRNLVLSYEDILDWMEKMEKNMEKFRSFSVFTEKLTEQTENLHTLTEEIVGRQKDVDNVTAIGMELTKHIGSGEALQLKDKVDSLQRKFADLALQAGDSLKMGQEMLPLVENFHRTHNLISEWLTDVEEALQSLDSHNLREQEIEITRLEQSVSESRHLMERLNQVGPRLCQVSPGEGSRVVEELVARNNKRFDSICEQTQRKSERIKLSKQRSLEVVQDINDLLDWYREVESQILDAEPSSSEPNIIRVQLKEQKALNDDISSQRGRVRDILSNAKKVLRESTQTTETEQLKEKIDDLKETVETVIKLSNDRLCSLEQALPLSEHFHDTRNELTEWLDEIEKLTLNQLMPGVRPDLIGKQQETNRSFLQSTQSQKGILDRLNKTGGALSKLVAEEDALQIRDQLNTINERYSRLKLCLRDRQQSLEEAMQECSQLTDKLDGMLSSLSHLSSQLGGAEPIAVHPEKLREQIEDNIGIMDDLGKKEPAYEGLKKVVEDILEKAPVSNDPLTKDIHRKVEHLKSLWIQVQKGVKERSDMLKDTLGFSEKFWSEIHANKKLLRRIEENLAGMDSPSLDSSTMAAQNDEVKILLKDIENASKALESCKMIAKKLNHLVGESEKPEIKHQIREMDNNIQEMTVQLMKREKNLKEVAEKSALFQHTLDGLVEFLEKAERKFDNMGPIGTDIDGVKKQIENLKAFKTEIDPWMVKVEASNRQASDLTETSSLLQAKSIKESLSDANLRWEELNKGVNSRQKELEHALLRLGQFQHALSELLVWIDCTEKTLNSLRPCCGDPPVIEVEMAKLKVMSNDIQAHQSSVDTLNDAGRQIIESDKESSEASQTSLKLMELNEKWNQLLSKSQKRQSGLEDALREAQDFHAEIQDVLMWLNDVDASLAFPKPVGGLPETAREQLQTFMELFHEVEDSEPKIATLLGRGVGYLKKSTDGSAGGLHNNLQILESRWENTLTRANDKKIKLEIAFKEASDFHNTLQGFIDWLTHSEKILANMKPASRVLEVTRTQIEDHKGFQGEVSSQREVMLSLDKKGTHLKYFSQKQDVILIKNLLVSVQNRWEKIVSKSAERTRALDFAYKEAKEFQESFELLSRWLEHAAKSLGNVSPHSKNDPDKIKKEIEQHREFQKELNAQQNVYDATMKLGKALKDKGSKSDEVVISNMMAELKSKWIVACNLSVERQRKLEEALLLSGQFKDALKALMDWLETMTNSLDDKLPVYGDLDTVIGLIEKHNSFEGELSSRTEQIESLKKTAANLLKSASVEDAGRINSEVSQINQAWEQIWTMCKNKTKCLQEALNQAEELQKSFNLLLEWLTDAEMKLRFSGPLPDDVNEANDQVVAHQKFIQELESKEKSKDATLNLANDILSKCHPDAVTVIKHWITIASSRWEEVFSWAIQRFDKLQLHLHDLNNMLDLLDELMQWLSAKEIQLSHLEQETLPDDIEEVFKLIEQHQAFMDTLTSKQLEVDSVCKPYRCKPTSRKTSKSGPKTTGNTSRGVSPEQLHPEFSSFAEEDLTNSTLRDYPKPWLDFFLKSKNSFGDRATPDRKGSQRLLDTRKPSKTSGGSPDIKNPHVKALWDKWRHVWMMATEYEQRLKDKLNYLKELEKVKNFEWEEWKRKFLRHHNNKKSRVSDLFRKLDDDADGFISREDFVDGILKNKFGSSRLEMNAVADKFDKGDNSIDWREFISALRPDWQERGPLTDTERIDDEINKQIALCSCKQKFKVYQVGEGKYRFGDSQKLRLVRILRSTVMVRVGGGWAALEEFLLKNDPCRVFMGDVAGSETGEPHEWWCPLGGIHVEIIHLPQQSSNRKDSKGRTNVELREQFTLATGVSQSMTPFRSKPFFREPSPEISSSGKSVQRLTTVGPITKIREKTERSFPMSGNSSYDPSQISRRQSGFSGTRAGSRPHSQMGSNLSLNSDESSLRGSGVRRTSSMRSGYNGRAVVDVGSGLSTPRKVSSPYSSDVRVMSNSLIDKTPLSERTRSRSYIAPRPSNLIKSTSATNIPKFVGCFSSTNNSAATTPNRSRTPSSSSIPVPINQRIRPSEVQSSTGGPLNPDAFRKSSKTTTSTSYGADGLRITKTSTTTFQSS